MKTAKLLAKMSGWTGDARVFECEPPMPGNDWDNDAKGPFQYVIVSATNVMFFGPETYIFPAKKSGDVFEVEDFGELDGSYRGGLSHEEALNNAGYEIVP